MLNKVTTSIFILIQLSIAVCWGQTEKGILKLNTNKPLTSQISEKVKIYEVDSVIDLKGKTVKLPEGSQIVFNGGCIKNGTIEAKCVLLNEWSFENVKIKGNIDFISPVAVPVKNPKEFISTILEYKPMNSDLPTVFIFSSNQTYNWEGELYINKKNVTLTGGGTIEGHIHIGYDSDTFKELKYDAYSATSHANIIISNLRFSKYHIIGSSDDPDRIEKYVQKAELIPENIAISLINSCHIKIEGCFFDNVPYPIVYTPNDNFINQNVRRLNIVNCDFEFCHTAVYAPSKTKNSLEYGDLVFSNNNVLPTHMGLNLSCIDGLKVYNNTFNTCAKYEYGSNIYAEYPGQVVITNNSFYGEYNGEAVVLDCPGVCLIDGNLFSSQGTSFAPSLNNGYACIKITRSNKTCYSSGLSITNNLFTNVNRLPIYAEGYFRGANIQGNLVSGIQYRTNKGVLYYFNSSLNDEIHLQPMKMTDNILEDVTGTLELRMDVISDLLNSNALYPERALIKNNKIYTMRRGNDYIPVRVIDCIKTKPIYVVSVNESSFSGDVSLIFNGAQYLIKVYSKESSYDKLNALLIKLKEDFGDTHIFKIIDNNLWIVGKSVDVPVITPMWENNKEVSPLCFQVVYQNLGYSLKVKDTDGKNIIDIPLYNHGIDLDDDGKTVCFGSVKTILRTKKTNRKAELVFRERPEAKRSYKWLYNDMFFASGDGGKMKTSKLLSEIVSLCYSDKASVSGNSLILKEPDKEYGFHTIGYTWYSTYSKHVADYMFVTDLGIEFYPETGSYNNSGASSLRPKSPNVGFQYFDTTLGLPIYWNGSAWVDSAGNVR